MRTFISASIVLAASSLAGLAYGHGLPFNLYADSESNLHSVHQAYWGDEATFEPFSTGSETLLRWRGAFTVPTPSSGIADGTVLSFNVTGIPTLNTPQYHGQALLYWNGTDVVPTAETLTIIRGGTTILLDQNDTFLPGALIGNYNAATLGWHGTVSFFLPETAAPGLYAVGLQVTSPDYVTSETFWAIGNNGMTAEQYQQGVAAIMAVVPEPTSGVLALVGLGLTIGAVCRRRHSH